MNYINNSLSNIYNTIYYIQFFNNNNNKIYFRLLNFSYIFSFRFNIIRVEYFILFFYKNSSYIIPSDLSLYFNLHIICKLNSIETNSTIDSLASIHQNKFFKCIEYVNINEKINFGIQIYRSKARDLCINYTKYFFSDSNFNYNKHLFQNNKIFYPLFNEKKFYLEKENKSLSLKKIYIKNPNYNTKSKIIKNDNNWEFINIYNHYFCSCRGHNCLYSNLINHKNSTQICKYRFYLNLIEENKYLYNKSYYLLADFDGDFESFDDSFPIFQKLIDLGKSAYYMTINKIILRKTNINKGLFKYIIKGNFIDGDFLENYFSLFLKLKTVISAAKFFSFSNLFFYIDYITFISLTHGLNYFKSFLFKTYYGRTRYHKIVISTSEKIISLAIKNGWQENDLIKICLPKWDIFNLIKNRKLKSKTKSIFIFFTWRIWRKNISDEMKLNSDYFHNIIELINNKYLIESLRRNEIILNFCLHHMLEIYKDKINIENKNVKFIKQNQIFRCITRSSLLVTDFSSIIFEFIYQKKPYIMFIPDSEDLNIEQYYISNYYKLIKDLKEDRIGFMNKFFDINHVVEKIIYYINNSFAIEKNLSDFYKSFNLTCGNNTKKFINYIENIIK